MNMISIRPSNFSTNEVQIMTEFTANRHVLGYYEAHPKPSPEALSQFYRDKYFQAPKGSYSPSYLPQERAYFTNLARVAHHLADRQGCGHSLLDLGCGEGFFAAAFHQWGWQVALGDYSEFGLMAQNPELRPYFSAGDLHGLIETFKTEGKRFGLINLSNVLEHVPEPEPLLHSLRPLVGEGGLIRVRVPNDFSAFQMALMAVDATPNTWFVPPEHLLYFTSESLRRLVEACGLKVVSLQAGFPIESFLANPHANYAKDRTLGKGAHLARVFCEIYQIERDIDAYIALGEAAARLDYGRDLVAYISI